MFQLKFLLWWGCHLQDFGWHSVRPSLVFLSDVCVIFLSDLLSNLFSHLSFSECMSEAISVVWNRLWKPSFKNELELSDFYQLTMVCMEIFSNHFTCKILFNDTQSRLTIIILDSFMLASYALCEKSIYCLDSSLMCSVISVFPVINSNNFFYRSVLN